MSNTIQKMLADDEKILNQGRIHPIVFVWPVSLVVLALLASLFHPIMTLVILVLTLYPAYNAYIHYTMTYLVLTDRKVLYRSGFLTRDWIRMDFEKVENAYQEEPIIGRIIGYSTVTVNGVGQGNIVTKQVANGTKFIKDLEEQLNKNTTKVEVVKSA